MASRTLDEAKLKEAFCAYDADGSGYIDSSELKAALSDALKSVDEEVNDEKLNALTQAVMSAVDTSGDGKISFEEFKTAFLSSGLFCPSCEPGATPEPWERPDTGVTPEPWTDRPDTACSDAGQ